MYHNFLRIQLFDDFRVVTCVPLSVPMHPFGNRNGGMPLAINWRSGNSVCLRPATLAPACVFINVTVRVQQREWMT